MRVSSRRPYVGTGGARPCQLPSCSCHDPVIELCVCDLKGGCPVLQYSLNLLQGHAREAASLGEPCAGLGPECALPVPSTLTALYSFEAAHSTSMSMASFRICCTMSRLIWPAGARHSLRHTPQHQLRGAVWGPPHIQGLSGVLSVMLRWYTLLAVAAVQSRGLVQEEQRWGHTPLNRTLHRLGDASPAVQV